MNQLVYIIHNSSEFRQSFHTIRKIPFMFCQKTTHSRNLRGNVKNLFHEQGDYDESCPIHCSYFMFFFTFSHLSHSSSRVAYSRHYGYWAGGHMQYRTGSAMCSLQILKFGSNWTTLRPSISRSKSLRTCLLHLYCKKPSKLLENSKLSLTTRRYKNV